MSNLTEKPLTIEQLKNIYMTTDNYKVLLLLLNINDNIKLLNNDSTTFFKDKPITMKEYIKQYRVSQNIHRLTLENDNLFEFNIKKINEITIKDRKKDKFNYKIKEIKSSMDHQINYYYEHISKKIDISNDLKKLKDIYDTTENNLHDCIILMNNYIIFFFNILQKIRNKSDSVETDIKSRIPPINLKFIQYILKIKLLLKDIDKLIDDNDIFNKYFDFVDYINNITNIIERQPYYNINIDSVLKDDILVNKINLTLLYDKAKYLKKNKDFNQYKTLEDLKTIYQLPDYYLTTQIESTSAVKTINCYYRPYNFLYELFTNIEFVPIGLFSDFNPITDGKLQNGISNNAKQTKVFTIEGVTTNSTTNNLNPNPNYSQVGGGFKWDTRFDIIVDEFLKKTESKTEILNDYHKPIISRDTTGMNITNKEDFIREMLEKPVNYIYNLNNDESVKVDGVNKNVLLLQNFTVNVVNGENNNYLLKLGNNVSQSDKTGHMLKKTVEIFNDRTNYLVVPIDLFNKNTYDGKILLKMAHEYFMCLLKVCQNFGANYNDLFAKIDNFISFLGEEQKTSIKPSLTSAVFRRTKKQGDMQTREDINKKLGTSIDTNNNYIIFLKNGDNYALLLKEKENSQNYKIYRLKKKDLSFEFDNSISLSDFNDGTILKTLGIKNNDDNNNDEKIYHIFQYLDNGASLASLFDDFKKVLKVLEKKLHNWASTTFYIRFMEENTKSQNKNSRFNYIDYNDFSNVNIFFNDKENYVVNTSYRKNNNHNVNTKFKNNLITLNEAKQRQQQQSNLPQKSVQPINPTIVPKTPANAQGTSANAQGTTVNTTTTEEPTNTTTTAEPATTTTETVTIEANTATQQATEQVTKPNMSDILQKPETIVLSSENVTKLKILLQLFRKKIEENVTNYNKQNPENILKNLSYPETPTDKQLNSYIKVIKEYFEILNTIFFENFDKKYTGNEINNVELLKTYLKSITDYYNSDQLKSNLKLKYNEPQSNKNLISHLYNEKNGLFNRQLKIIDNINSDNLDTNFIEPLKVIFQNFTNLIFWYMKNYKSNFGFGANVSVGGSRKIKRKYTKNSNKTKTVRTKTQQKSMKRKLMKNKTMKHKLMKNKQTQKRKPKNTRTINHSKRK